MNAQPGNVRRETDYFAKVPFWLQDHPSDKVTAIVLGVYSAIYRSAEWNPNEDSQSGAWPSQETIASRARCSVRSVRRAVDVLQDLGVLHVEERPGRTPLYSLRTSDPGHSGRTSQDMVADPPRTQWPTTRTPISRTPNQTFEVVAERQPDLLWEIVVEIHGEPATKTERGKFNKAAALLREADVTPDEYPALAQAYVSKYGDLQPAIMTIATRVGEMRHYLRRGPIQAPGVADIAEHQKRQAQIAEYERQQLKGDAR